MQNYLNTLVLKRSFQPLGRLFMLIAVFGVVLAPKVQADDDVVRLQQAAGSVEQAMRDKRSMRLASYQPQASSRSFVSKSFEANESDLGVRLGMFGGPASALSTTAVEKKSNIYVGAQGDFQFSYFGLEADFFYGFPDRPSLENLSSSVPSSYDETIGGSVSLKAQVAIPLGYGSKVVPKLGVGYGGCSIGLPVEDGNEAIKVNASAYHLLVGFDLYATPSILVSADLTPTINGGGSTYTGNSSTLTATAYPDASLSRFRASVSFNIYRSIWLGGQFVQRTVVMDPNVVDKQSQFLGMLSFGF